MPCTVQIPPSFQCLLTTTAPPNPMDLVLPYVIFWNPLAQFPLLKEQIQICPHNNCGGMLVFREWSNGRTKGIQPRLLQGTHYTILLVGAIYSCSTSTHTVHSTDPRLLNSLGTHNLPFFLLHRSGFTREFVNCVVCLAKEGLPITAIARHMQNMREEFAAEIISTLLQWYKCHFGKEFTQEEVTKFTTSDCINSILKPFPTNDLIARCFIVHFQQNECTYLSSMESIKIRKYICIDHTFKVASNIGYLRSDGKWVTLYESIFIVLNEEGVVVAWQFTKTHFT